MKSHHPIKLEYDPDVDAAYLTLRRGKVVRSERAESGVILDLDAHDQIIGVEMLRFARRFKEKVVPRKRVG